MFWSASDNNKTKVTNSKSKSPLCSESYIYDVRGISPARVPRLECYLKVERLFKQNVAFPYEFITDSTTSATLSVRFIQSK